MIENWIWPKSILILVSPALVISSLFEYFLVLLFTLIPPISTPLGYMVYIFSAIMKFLKRLLTKK